MSRAIAPLLPRLAQVPPALAEARRRLHARALALEGATSRLSLQACDAPAETECVELQVGADLVLFRIDAFGHPAGRAEPGWADCTGRARLLAWGLAHESIVTRLEALLGLPVLPLRMVCAAAGVGDRVDWPWLGWTLADADGTRSRGRLAAPVALLLGWLETTPAPLPWPPALSGMPAALATALPPVRLTPGQAAAIRPGAVIVLGERAALLQALSVSCRAPDGALWMRWTAAPGPDGLTLRPGAADTVIDLSLSQEASTMADTRTAPPAPSEETAAGSDGLRLQLEFELGRTSLGLQAAAALQPGYVFELPAPAAGAQVAIRAHGRLVGEGELVAVGEVLGVRVTRWGSDGL